VRGDPPDTTPSRKGAVGSVSRRKPNATEVPQRVDPGPHGVPFIFLIAVSWQRALHNSRPRRPDVIVLRATPRPKLFTERSHVPAPDTDITPPSRQ